MKRRSREDWKYLVEQYEHRECNQSEFCKRHGISSASLRYHLNRKKQPLSFLPVATQLQESFDVSLEFPSGIRLTIRG